MKQITHLVPAVQLVTETAQRYYDGHITLNDFKDITTNYCAFLTTPLRLGFFIPCTQDDLPMLMPGSAPIYTHSENYIVKYKEAKSRCLFEGFSLRNNDLFYKEEAFWIFRGGLKFSPKETMEMIQGIYDYELTPTAIQQIYGR